MRGLLLALLLPLSASAAKYGGSIPTPVTEANGGTSTSTVFSNGAVLFSTAPGNTYAQDPNNFNYNGDTKALGLKTGNPAFLLHMSSGTLKIDGNTPQLSITGVTSTVAPIVVGASTFTVLNNGNVGIGIANPAATIHCSSCVAVFDGTTPQMIIGAGSIATSLKGVLITRRAYNSNVPGTISSGNLNLDAVGTVGDYTSINFGFMNNDGSALANAPASISFNTTNSAANSLGDLVFGTRNVTTDTPPTIAVRINSGGSTQFGTGTTVSTMAANGNVVVGGKVGVNLGVGDTPAQSIHLSSGTLYLDGNTPQLSIQGVTSTVAPIVVGASTFTVLNNGNVGIGTANPASILHISSGVITLDGTSPAINIGTMTQITNSVFQAVSGGTFTVQTNGYIGVNTASPKSLIHVSSGTILFDGAPTAIKIGTGAFVASSVFQVISGSTFTILNNGYVGINQPAPLVPLDVTSTLQGIGIPVLTTAQTRLSTPARTGALIFNSTLPAVCVSTGTATLEAYQLVGNTLAVKCE